MAHGRLDGAIALVIGGAHGIGRATVERLAVEGASVRLADLDADQADVVTRSLPGAGHRSVDVDVREPSSVTSAITALGELDLLVHVAGGDTPHGVFEEIDDETWRSMHELNLLGPVRSVRAGLPALRRSPRGGAVVLVGSVNADLSLGSEPYSAAKAGLASVVRNLAASLGSERIRVNGVTPGTIRTRVWDDQDGPDRLAPLYPLGRIGEPEDVAAAIAFLCSADAAWITGHMLPVDGGLSVRQVVLD